MNQYHKINTVWKRDEKGYLLLGEFSQPEFQYLAQNEWEFSEKVDGTNIRVMWQEDPLDYRVHELTFGGKTNNAQLHAPLVKHLQDYFGDDQNNLFGDAFGDERGTNVCLYGEGYGAGIQKGGGNYGPQQKFILFDVLVNGWWLKRKDMEDVARKLGIDVVPRLSIGTLYDMNTLCKPGFASTLIKDEMDRSGAFDTWSSVPFAEGIVARPMTELKTRRGDRIITKLKHKDFDRVK